MYIYVSIYKVSTLHLNWWNGSTSILRNIWSRETVFPFMFLYLSINDTIVLNISSNYIQNDIRQCYVCFSHQIKFRKLKKKGNLLYLPIFLFNLFFLTNDAIFLLLYFPSCLESSLNHSLEKSLLVTRSLNFPSSDNIVIFPSFLKEVSLLNIGFWVDSSFNTWKTVLFPFSLHSLWCEIHCHSYYLLGKVSFLVP